MNPITVILSGMICIVASSCKSDKTKKEAEAKAREFFSAIKNENEEELSRLYPGISNFEHYFKSDSGKIVSTSEASGIITVTVDNRYTNTFGKLSEESIRLYYKVDSIGNANLYDTKGLTDFAENNNYIFASKTGCIVSRIDTTDQQILRKLKRAKEVMLDKAVALYLELKTNIRVINWNWESGYGGSASGNAIVWNGSTYRIPKLRYKVTYRDQIGNPITTDDGYVTYDGLDAGESKSFTFYTSYVGGASKASIELLFDDDVILNYLSKKAWMGNECELYFKSHQDTLLDR